MVGRLDISGPKTIWNTEITPRSYGPSSKKLTITKDLELVSSRGITAIIRQLFHAITLYTFNPSQNDRLMIATLKNKLDSQEFHQLSDANKSIFASNVEVIRQNIVSRRGKDSKVVREFDAKVHTTLSSKMMGVKNEKIVVTHHERAKAQPERPNLAQNHPHTQNATTIQARQAQAAWRLGLDPNADAGNFWR